MVAKLLNGPRTTSSRRTLPRQCSTDKWVREIWTTASVDLQKTWRWQDLSTRSTRQIQAKLHHVLSFSHLGLIYPQENHQPVQNVFVILSSETFISKTLHRRCDSRLFFRRIYSKTLHLLKCCRTLKRGYMFTALKIASCNFKGRIWPARQPPPSLQFPSCSRMLTPLIPTTSSHTPRSFSTSPAIIAANTVIRSPTPEISMRKCSILRTQFAKCGALLHMSKHHRYLISVIRDSWYWYTATIETN